MKKLPKAILQTADAMRESAAAAQRPDRFQPVAGPTTTATRNSTAAARIVPPDPEASATLVANDAGPVTVLRDDTFEVRHRSMARRIVERHANLSAIGGVVPLPILNVAGVTAIILRMLKKLSYHYGVPFERERARMIVVGLTGGCMPTGLAAVTASTLSFVLPGSNLFGLAVCSVTASACTRGIGKMFIELFENGATWRDLPPLEKR